MSRPAPPAPTLPLLAPHERWADADELRWAARAWAVRIDVPLRRVSVRPLRDKWASISTAGTLTLSAELLAHPRTAGEYVIVHELVHLLCPQGRHGRLFKAFMRAYLPDWEARHAALVGAPPSYGGPTRATVREPARHYALPKGSVPPRTP